MLMMQGFTGKGPWDDFVQSLFASALDLLDTPLGPVPPVAQPAAAAQEQSDAPLATSEMSRSAEQLAAPEHPAGAWAGSAAFQQRFLLGAVSPQRLVLPFPLQPWRQTGVGWICISRLSAPGIHARSACTCSRNAAAAGSC
jgi:hypothetical protein